MLKQPTIKGRIAAFAARGLSTVNLFHKSSARSPHIRLRIATETEDIRGNICFSGHSYLLLVLPVTPLSFDATPSPPFPGGSHTDLEFMSRICNET